MNEADIRRYIQGAISRLGAYYYHSPDVNMLEIRSRPDIIGGVKNGCAIIEVKKCAIMKHKIGVWKDKWNGIFRFNELRNNQRHLLDSAHVAEIPTYFGIGSVGGRFAHRTVMLIPWKEWFEMELSQPTANSVYFTTIAEKFYDAYGLPKDSDGYYFNTDHPIVSQLTSAVPFTYIENPLSRRFEEKKKVKE